MAWALGEVPLFIVMTALFVQWRRTDEKDAARYDRNAERDHDAELEAYNAMLAARTSQSMTDEEREYYTGTVDSEHEVHLGSAKDAGKMRRK